MALAYQLLAQYILASSHAEVSRQLPAFQAAYIREQVHLKSEKLSEVRILSEAFAELDSANVFPQALEMLLDGFEGWLE